MITEGESGPKYLELITEGYGVVNCTSGLESAPAPQAAYRGAAGKNSLSLAGTWSCWTADHQQYEPLYRTHTMLKQP